MDDLARLFVHRQAQQHLRDFHFRQMRGMVRHNHFKSAHDEINRAANVDIGLRVFRRKIPDLLDRAVEIAVQQQAVAIFIHPAIGGSKRLGVVAVLAQGEVIHQRAMRHQCVVHSADAEVMIGGFLDEGIAHRHAAGHEALLDHEHGFSRHGQRTAGGKAIVSGADDDVIECVLAHCCSSWIRPLF